MVVYWFEEIYQIWRNHVSIYVYVGRHDCNYRLPNTVDRRLHREAIPQLVITRVLAAVLYSIDIESGRSLCRRITRQYNNRLQYS